MCVCVCVCVWSCVVLCGLVLVAVIVFIVHALQQATRVTFENKTSSQVLCLVKQASATGYSDLANDPRGTTSAILAAVPISFYYFPS